MLLLLLQIFLTYLCDMETLTKVGTGTVSTTKMAIATVALLAASASAFALLPSNSELENEAECRRDPAACLAECVQKQVACAADADSPGGPHDGGPCDQFWPDSVMNVCNKVFSGEIAVQVAATNRPNGSACMQGNECASSACQNGVCVSATVDLVMNPPTGALTLGQGDTMSVTGRVCNMGSVRTPGQVAVGGNVIQPNGSTDLRTFYVGPIEPGACVDSPAMTQSQVQAGIIRVSFWVDANNQVTEVNENNNLVNTEITVTAPAGAAVGPCPQPVSGSPVQCATAYGNCVKYTTTHRDIRYYRGAWQSLCRACVGGSLNASTNNCQTLPAALPPAPGPAPLPDFSFSPTEPPTLGTDGTLTFRFGNIGNGPVVFNVGQTVARTEFLNAQGQMVGNPVVTTVTNTNGAGGASWTFLPNVMDNVINQTLQVPSGASRVRVTLDPENRAAETNELNNSRELNIPAPAGPVCGNGQCQSGESTATCPADCPAPASNPAPISANDTRISFFITSRGNGTNGGNYGGLAGADAFCNTLATAPGAVAGASSKVWRAYLSAGTQQNPTHARNRIGSGPWYNARQELIARDVDDLHRPSGLSSSLIFDERGNPVVNSANNTSVGGDHDVLTGSSALGMLYQIPDNETAPAPTCNNWTNGTSTWADALAFAMVGHADWTAVDTQGDERSRWNSSHTVPCSPESLQSTAGSGRLYCFAVGNR